MPPDAAIDATAVERVLATVSVDDAGGDRTVVKVDRTFRTGLLHGRHTKPAAEHIGATARRAALERQRAAAAETLVAAEAVLAQTDREVALRDTWIGQAAASASRCRRSRT